MKHFFLALSLSASLVAASPLLASATPEAGLEAGLTDFSAYEDVIHRFPGQFLSPDLSPIKALDAVYKDASLDEIARLDNTHCEALVGTARLWQETLRAHLSPTAQTFVREIDETITSQGVTPMWLTYMPLRFAASISQSPNEDECTAYNSEIFQGEISYEQILSLWQNPSAFKGYMDQYPPLKDLRFFAPTHVPEKRVFLPFLGLVELSLHDIVYMNLTTLAPVAIPLESIKGRVHSITNPTPLGFALHDILHGRNSVFSIPTPKDDSTELASLPEGSSITREPSPFEDPKTLALATGAHDALIGALRYLADKALAHGVDSPTFRQAIFSIFAIHHESSPWPIEAFMNPTLEGALISLIRHTKGLDDDVYEPQDFAQTYYEKEFGVDIFQTSPFDGTSPLSDEEIADTMTRLTRTPESPVELFPRSEAAKDKPVRAPHKITASATFVSKESWQNPVTQETTYSHMHIVKKGVFTLNYRIKNAQGTRSMLKAAGMKDLPKPVTFESLLAGRKPEVIGESDTRNATQEAVQYLNTLGVMASDILDAGTLFARDALALDEAAPHHARQAASAAALAKHLAALEEGL
ncbi:MAG: hypothetical protein C0514_02225 [Candidatus Puniceispirillum sp.]|nr:hypothetical protein [Candidatus Puniceispirillum sp.]